DVLPPNVQGRREHAPCLPADGLLRPTPWLPDEAFARAVQNVQNLFKQITLRLGLGIRRKLAEVADVDALAADQIDVSAFDARAEPPPRLDFRLPYVRNVVVLIY